MSLNAPTKMVFLISLVLAVLALLGAWVISIPVISGNAFLMTLLAYVVLAAGNILKGMYCSFRAEEGNSSAFLPATFA